MKGEITIQEFKNVLHYILDNNEKLTASGKSKVVIEALGSHGVGKTESIIQVADERGMKVVKINLAQIEELGDFVGMPVKEYKVLNSELQEVWVNEKVLDGYLKSGYTLSSNTESRMSYAIPQWVPLEDEKTILLLDDFRRADPRYMQALMELLSRGEYISWKLPENTHVVLSSNPDTGDYNVSSLDPAQRNRFVSFNVKFNLEDWAKWAESEGIESRIVNFCLFYPEIFTQQNTGVTPRSIVIFANAISGITDFSNSDSLSLINIIAEGCFESEENIIGKFFTMFVNNKLDRLINPKDMLLDEWKSVSARIRNVVYDGEKFRSDISSVLAIRFLNYVDLYFDQPNANSDVVNKRVLELVGSEKVLLTEDIVFKLIKTLVSKHPKRTTKLLTNDKVRKAIIG